MKNFTIFLLFLAFFFVELKFSFKEINNFSPIDIKESMESAVLLPSFSLGGTFAYAQEKKRRSGKKRKAKRKSKELDVSKIAEEYWRPQRDRLGVIQGRRFKKKGRLEFSPLYGFYQSRQYTDSNSYGLSIVYNFNETWGLDLSYMRIQNSDSDFLESLREDFPGLNPGFNLEKSHGILALTWSPIYAKFAFLGNKISHFETYLSLGVGFTETTKRNLTYSVAIGERFYLSDKLLFRVEWRISHYTDDEIVKKDREGSETLVSDSPTRANLILGLGWLF